MRKKVYGQSRIDTCMFCGSTATSKNSQGLPVCREHVGETQGEKRCACGALLEVKESKWGPFYLCENCGPVSLTKAQDTEGAGYKLNKRYRKESIPTFDELSKQW